MIFNISIQLRADNHDQIQSDLSNIKKAVKRRKNKLMEGTEEIIEINGYNYDVKIANLKILTITGL